MNRATSQRDVAEFHVGGDENNQQTVVEVLLSTIATLPEDKLTEFALQQI